MAYLFKVDGSITKIEIDRSTERSGYDQMVKLVGGYIQMVDTWRGEVLICNEEGKLDKLPLNSNATLLYNTQNGFNAISPDNVFTPFDVIVGDCILASKEEAGYDI